VLIANERPDRLELLAQVVTHLGHEVIAREVEVKEVGAVTEREHPDVALVGVGICVAARRTSRSLRSWCSGTSSRYCADRHVDRN
jgi:hypothetical protein